MDDSVKKDEWMYGAITPNKKALKERESLKNRQQR